MLDIKKFLDYYFSILIYKIIYNIIYIIIYKIIYKMMYKMMYKMNNYCLIIIIIIIYKIFNIINIYSVDFILNSLYDIITNLDFATKIDFFKNPIKNIEYIPELPILTIYNRDKYIDWHIYYENIYKKHVQNDVNLNDFTWFYMVLLG